MNEFESQIIKLVKSNTNLSNIYNFIEQQIKNFSLSKKKSFLSSNGTSLIYNSQFESALIIFNYIIDSFREEEDKTITIVAYSNLSIIYVNIRNFIKALDNQKKAIEIAEHRVIDKDLLSTMYSNMSNIYLTLNNINKALDSQKKAIEISIDTNNTNFQKVGYKKIADILYGIGKYEMSIEYYEKALKIALKKSGYKEIARLYNSISFAFSDIGNADRAIDYYKKALSLYKDHNDTTGIVNCFINLGAEYCYKKDFITSKKFTEDALAIAKGNNLRSEANCYLTLSLIHYYIGDINNSINFAEKALDISRTINDLEIIGKALSNLSISFLQQHRVEDAIDFSQRALENAKNRNDLLSQLKSHVNLGTAYQKKYELDLSISHYKQALEIATDIHNKATESMCYAGLGRSYILGKKYDLANEYLSKILEFDESITDNENKAICYFSISFISLELGNYDNLLKFSKKALEIAKEINNKEIEAECCVFLGIANDVLGYFEKAKKNYYYALEIAKEINNKGIEIKCYSNIGIVEFKQGNYKKDLELQFKALKLAKEFKNKYSEGICYSNIANVYSKLNNSIQTINNLEDALNIAREIKNEYSQVICLSNLGNEYLKINNIIKALYYFEEGYQLSLKLNHNYLLYLTNMNLAYFYTAKNDFNKSLEFATKALNIAKKINSLDLVSECNLNIAKIYIHINDFNKSLEFATKALNIAKKINNLNVLLYSNITLGNIYNILKPNLSLQYLEEGLQLIELISKSFIHEEKIGFFSNIDIDKIYELIIINYLEREEFEKVFEYIEKSKSRTILELISSKSNIKPTVEIKPEFALLLKEEEKLLNELRKLYSRGINTELKFYELNTTTSIDEIKKTLEKIYLDMEKFDLKYVNLRKGNNISLKAVQNLLSKEENDLLIEYFLIEGIVIIFIITSTFFEVKTIPVDQHILKKYFLNFQKEVINYSGINVTNEWIDLGNYLIKPISSIISKSKTIFVISHKFLQLMPIHALKLGKDPLIKSNPVVYFPTASIMQFYDSNKNDSLQSCTSIGIALNKNETLFIEEAEKIAKIFDTYPISNITKNQLLRTKFDNDILHFSCHGYFYAKDPLSSGLILKNEDILTAREIFDLRIDSKLVTLSACETGVNESISGDALIGLTRALFYSGAKSIVVTLWKVHVLATMNFMISFYNNIKNGNTLPESLQKAQITLMEKEEYAHPYFWAGFILFGS